MAPEFPNLHLNLSALSGKDYAALISSSAIVALPYDPTEYRLKSSGVVWESIASSSTLVVPAHTWLAHECAYWESAHDTYTGNDAAAVSAAISRALEAGAVNALQAREAGRRFLAANGAKALFDTLVEKLPPRSIPLGGTGSQGKRIGVSAFSGPGWHELENYNDEEVRWCGGDAALDIVFPSLGDWRVTLSGPYCFGEEQLSSLQVFVDGVAIPFEQKIGEGNAWTVSLVFRETAATMPKRTLRLVTADTRQPGSDTRALALLCSGIDVCEEEGGSLLSDEFPAPVFSRFKPVGGEWTDAIRFGSWTFRNRPKTDGLLSFRFDAPTADIAMDTQVFIGGQRAETRFTEKNGVWLAQSKIDADKVARSETLSADIVFSLPHRVRMDRIKWRSNPGAMITDASPDALEMPVSVAPRGAAPVPATRSLDISERTRATWSFGDVQRRGKNKLVEIRVSGLKAGNKSYEPFGVKLHITDTSYVLELRESQNALALIGGVNNAQVRTDEWGSFLRLSVNRQGERTGPALSVIGEDTSGVRALLQELAAGIRQSGLDDKDDWINAAVKLGRLLPGETGQRKAPASAANGPAASASNGAALHTPADLASASDVEWSCSIVNDVDEGSVAKFRVKGFKLGGRTLEDFSFRIYRFDDSYALQLSRPDGGFQLLEQPREEFLGDDVLAPAIILSVDRHGNVLGPKLDEIASDAGGVSLLLHQFLGGMDSCDIPNAPVWKQATRMLVVLTE